MADEAGAVGRGPGVLTQPHFEGGERTKGSEPGLGNDDANGGQMTESEPPSVDPAPAAQVADNDCRQAADDKDDHGDMEDEHRIGQQERQGRVIHGGVDEAALFMTVFRRRLKFNSRGRVMPMVPARAGVPKSNGPKPLEKMLDNPSIV